MKMSIFKVNKTFRCIFLIFSIVLFSACGSGGKVSDPPQAPQPTITAKSEKVIIEWENINDAFFYNIYWDDKPGVSINSVNKVKVEKLTTEIEGLSNDTTYYFIVTAVGDGNESETSIELVATPIAVPGAPVNLKASPGDNALKLSWEEVNQASEYHIFVTNIEDNSTNSDPIISTEISHTLDNLENGKKYKILIKAINGSGESTETIIEEAVPTSIITLAAGSEHTCVIKSDHSLWCWGNNSEGEIGDGTKEMRTSPVRVGEDNDWTKIALGLQYSCATKLDHSLWCWGDNSETQLGDATLDEIFVPTQIDLGHDVESLNLASQTQTTCEIDTLNTLYCWGQNFWGQAGSDTYDTPVAPAQVGEEGEWSSVTVGALHGCAIKLNGTLWCWGANYLGQLGNGTYVGTIAPLAIGELENWQFTSVGSSESCVINDEGDLWCWGFNASGQLGDGTEDLQGTPVAIAEEESWSSVSIGGGAFTCAIHTDKSLWCWGDNASGQLGDGSLDNKNTPYQIDAGNDWAIIQTGDSHACALKTSGDLYCWGKGASGQLGVADMVDITSDSPWLLEPTLVEFSDAP